MGQGEVFADVGLFTGGSFCIPTVPWEGRPPPQKVDPLSQKVDPPPGYHTAMGYGQQAGCTHPTGTCGMHTCLNILTTAI